MNIYLLKDVIYDNETSKIDNFSAIFSAGKRSII